MPFPPCLLFPEKMGKIWGKRGYSHKYLTTQNIIFDISVPRALQKFSIYMHGLLGKNSIEQDVFIVTKLWKKLYHIFHNERFILVVHIFKIHNSKDRFMKAVFENLSRQNKHHIF